MILSAEKYELLDYLNQLIITNTKKTDSPIYFNIDLGTLDFILECHSYPKSFREVIDKMIEHNLIDKTYRITFKCVYHLSKMKFI